MTAQAVFPGRIAVIPGLGSAPDLCGQNTIESAAGKQPRPRRSGSERDDSGIETVAKDRGHHVADAAPDHHSVGSGNGGLRWKRSIERSNVVTGLRSGPYAAPAFQNAVGLERRRHAHAFPAADLAQRGQTPAGPRYTATDQTSDLVRQSAVQECGSFLYHGNCYDNKLSYLCLLFKTHIDYRNGRSGTTGSAAPGGIRKCGRRFPGRSKGEADAEHWTAPGGNAAVVFILGCGGLVSAADNWMVAPILPSISDGLDVSIAQGAMALTAYMIPYGVMQPVHGYLSERCGRVRFLRRLMLGLTLGTIGCALSPSLIWLCATVMPALSTDWRMGLPSIVALGLGYVFIQSTMATLAFDVGARGLSSSLAGLGLFGGDGVSSAVESIILARYGYETLWCVSAVGTIIATAAMLRNRRLFERASGSGEAHGRMPVGGKTGP